MNTLHSPRGHGRNHGADDLRRHQRHLEHRNRGTRAHPARTHDRKPASPLHSTQRAHHAAAKRAPSTPRAPVTVRVAAHTLPPQQQPRPQSSIARAHATLHAARAARARIAPPPEAAPPNSEASDTTKAAHEFEFRCEFDFG